jgi:tRNA threonylcarbamoyladenosine biosynthesis protein TsaB
VTTKEDRTMTTPQSSRPVLAFDTATPTARVALLSPVGECLVERERTAARHSANLLALCDEVLRDGGATVAGLGGILCGAGPGSFTGLRVGLAVAKGLALPTGLPLVMVSSLDALACDLAKQAPDAALLLPCLDAGKGQVYARLYAAGADVPKALGEADWVLAPQDLVRLGLEAAAGQSVCGGGTGVDRYREVFSAATGVAICHLLAGPSPSSLGRLGLDRLARGLIDDIETAVPRSGRPPDITRPKKALLSP